MNKAEILDELWIKVEPAYVSPGAMIVDGQWYVPKFGCDTLDMMLEEADSKQGGE